MNIYEKFENLITKKFHDKYQILNQIYLKIIFF